jgi:hypothetical protein
MRTQILSLFFVGIAAQGSARAADLKEQMVQVLERQAADVDDHRPDCDAILTALLRHVDDDAAVSRKLRAADRGKSPAQLKEEQSAFVAKYADRLHAATAKMGPLKACRTDPRLQQWKKKLAP